jgi:hypothetical protein
MRRQIEAKIKEDLELQAKDEEQNRHKRYVSGKKINKRKQN